MHLTDLVFDGLIYCFVQLQILEEKCIQFLMDHGLVASRSKIDGSRRSMADICFTILHAIHGNAKYVRLCFLAFYNVKVIIFKWNP